MRHHPSPGAGVVSPPPGRELPATRRAVNMFGSNVNQVAAAWHSTGGLPEWAAESVRMCAVRYRLDEVTARIYRRLRRSHGCTPAGDRSLVCCGTCTGQGAARSTATRAWWLRGTATETFRPWNRGSRPAGSGTSAGW